MGDLPGVADDPEARTIEQTIQLFKALSHPLRLNIVRELADGERAVHELVDHFEVRQPLVSQHLAVLRAARVVHAVRDGRETLYGLVDDHVAHIVGDAVHHSGEHPQG